MATKPEHKPSIAPIVGADDPRRFTDGAILDWLEHKDMTRTELRDLLLGSLAGSLTAAGWSP